MNQELQPSTASCVAPFPPLRYAELRLTLIADGRVQLHAQKGTALHGLLGHVLFNSLCRFEGEPACAGCWLRASCAYGTLFEELMPVPPPRGLKGIRTPPRPYVTVCDDSETMYERGSTLSFALRLFGRAADLQGSIALAWEDVARKAEEDSRSVGADERPVHDEEHSHRIEIRSGGFALLEIERVTANGTLEPLLYRRHPDAPFRLETLAAPPAVPTSRGLRIRFLSAAGLDRPTTNWLYALVEAIRRRAFQLSAIYQGWVDDGSSYSPLLRIAEKTKERVVMEKRGVQFRSGNNGATTRPLEGSHLTLEIDEFPDELRETLAWGTILHVGKNATSGLGRYVVEEM